MNHNHLIIKINWLYYSIKEQYQFINSFFNRLSKDQGMIKLLEKEIYFYKTSLILFKKSLSIFEFQYKNENYDKENIIKAKDVYLKRCLVNLSSALQVLENSPFFHNNLLIEELVSLFQRLIGNINDLGVNLSNWIK